MKASTYRYVTACSCALLAIVALPVIVGALAMRSPNPPMPADTRTNVRALFLVGIGKITETETFEVVASAASTFVSREPFLSHRIYRKAVMVAENLVEIDVVCDSKEMGDQIFQMLLSSHNCDIWVYGIEDNDPNNTLLVYRQSEDDVNAYLARIKAGEKIDWQAEADAYRLAQTEAEGKLPVSVE